MVARVHGARKTRGPDRPRACTRKIFALGTRGVVSQWARKRAWRAPDLSSMPARARCSISVISRAHCSRRACFPDHSVRSQTLPLPRPRPHSNRAHSLCAPWALARSQCERAQALPLLRPHPHPQPPAHSSAPYCLPPPSTTRPPHFHPAFAAFLPPGLVFGRPGSIECGFPHPKPSGLGWGTPHPMWVNPPQARAWGGGTHTRCGLTHPKPARAWGGGTHIRCGVPHLKPGRAWGGCTHFRPPFANFC